MTLRRWALRRDTNSWCPFCERVLCALVEKGIDFETVFIDLGNKPDWYLEMVPTALGEPHCGHIAAANRSLIAVMR